MHEPSGHHGGRHRRSHRSGPGRGARDAGPRLEHQLAGHHARHGKPARATGRHPAGHDRLLRPARQGPGAHAHRRPAPAQGLLGLPAAPAPPRCRRGAGHGRLCLFSGRHDGRAAGQAPRAGECRCGALDEQPGAAAGSRPRGLRLQRRGRGEDKERRRHRQPGAQRDRRSARAGDSLRRPHGPAAPAGGGRQPGCTGAQPNPAAGAGTADTGRATAGHAPDRRDRGRSRARGLCAGRHRSRGAALHRRHASASGSVRPHGLPRRRHHRERALRRRRAGDPGAAGREHHGPPARQRGVDGRPGRGGAPAAGRTDGTQAG